MEKPEAIASEPDEKPEQSGSSWPLWREIIIAGAVLLAMAISLGVGLGVGLPRRGSSGDDNENGGNSSNPSGLQNGPNRTTSWHPQVNATWQIVLKTKIKVNGVGNPNVDVWDLDLFENDAETLKSLHDAGKKVICYFSAGSYEDFRPDKDKFNASDLGKPLGGWPDERWLKLDSENVRNIMKERIRLAWLKGCDAIDPDNVDGYQNDNGLNLTAQDSIDFLKFLHQQAQPYHMAIGLKNAGGIIPDVLDIVDFSVNEQCAQYKECQTFSAFIRAGKPVFHIEYPDGAPKIDPKRAEELCSHTGISAGSDHFSTVLKKMNLDGFVQYCDGKQYNTPLGI